MQSIQAKCWHRFQPFLKRAGSKQQELSLARRCLPCAQNPGTTECGPTEINQPWASSRKHKLLTLLLTLCAYTDTCMLSCLIIGLLLSHPTPNPGTSFHQKTLASNFQSRISYLLSAPIPESAIHPSSRALENAKRRTGRLQATRRGRAHLDEVSQIYLKVEMRIDGAPPPGGAQH